MSTYWQRFVRTPLHSIVFRRRMREVRKDDPLIEQLEKVDFQPIFILGEGRSGTTILYELLYQTNGFNIVTLFHMMYESELLYDHLHGETENARKKLDKLIEDRGIANRGLDNISARSDSPFEFAYLLTKLSGCGYVTEFNYECFDQFCKKVQVSGMEGKPLLLKNIADGGNFKLLEKLYPQAKFVFIHRDPIDILISKMRAVGSPNRLLKIVSAEYGRFLKSRIYQFLVWLPKTRFGAGLAIFILTKRMMRFEKAYLRDVPTLNSSDWISIRYEDLCESPNEELTRILEFCGVDVPANLDMTSKIAPRQLKPLPVVECRRAKLEKFFESWRRHHGYIND